MIYDQLYQKLCKHSLKIFCEDQALIGQNQIIKDDLRAMFAEMQSLRCMRP